MQVSLWMDIMAGIYIFTETFYKIREYVKCYNYIYFFLHHICILCIYYPPPLTLRTCDCGFEVK